MKRHDFYFWKSITLFAIMLLATGCSTDVPATTTSAPTFTSTVTSAPPHTPTFTPLMLSTKGKIAFVYWNGKYDIYVMNANGSDLRNLTVDLPYSRDPAWSPDGQYIAFTSCQIPICQVYVMEADGSDLRQLTSDEAGSYNPAWSPDGKYIIFLSERDGVLSSERGVPVPEVYIMKSDGSEQRRITNNQDLNERSLSWSPMGDVIVASIGDPTISRHSIEIYLMGLDGVIREQLTEIGINSGPVWSPNGEFIVFSSLGRSDCSRINVMKADGSEQVCLIIDQASPPVQNGGPSWSPDNNHIIFSSNLDGDFDLYVVKVDGTGLMQLTNEPGDETSPVWSPVP